MAECVDSTQKYVGNALDMRCDDAISEKEQKAYNKGYVDGLQMRDFTKEEAEAYSKALDKMYKPTGFNVFDEPIEVEEIDYVQSHKKIPVTLDLTPSDIAISRQAVLDLVSKFILEIHSEGGRDLNAHTNDVLRQILRNVKSDRVLPPVNPQEPKTGHWKSTIDGKPICSECGFVSESEDGYFVSHYCPNCGCRMVEPQESEDKE